MTSNSIFLRALAQGASKGTQLMACAFPGDPAHGSWAGKTYQVGTRDEELVDGWGELNSYFAVASFSPLDGKVQRRLANFGGLLVLAVDDAPLDDLRSEPSYLVYTSPGKCQAGWFLDEADLDRKNLDLVSMLVTSMIGKGLIKGDKSGNNVVRWVRLPCGQNQKPRVSGHHDHQLAHWAPNIRYSLEDAAACVGVDLDELKERLAAKPVGTRVRTGLAHDEDPVQRATMWTRNILDGVDLHDSINQLAAHQVACGTPGGVVVNHLRTLMSVCGGAHDERWQARFDDIPRAVSSAEEKYTPEVHAPMFDAPTEEVVLAHQAAVEARHAEQLIPVALLNPGGILQELIEWNVATAHRPQPTLALAAAISCASTSLGRCVQGDTGLRTNMMLVCVAGTSSGKEHGRTVVTRALEEAGMERYLGGNEVASAPALLTRLQTSPNTLVQPDEYGLWLQAAKAMGQSHKTELMSLQMQLFGQTNKTYRGTEYANQKERKRVDIIAPCLNVHATTTMDTLLPALGGSEITSGFLNRILFLQVPDGIVKYRKPPLNVPVPEGVLAWMKAVNQLAPDGPAVEGQPTSLANMNGLQPVVVPNSPPAELMVEAFRSWADQRVADGAKSGIGALFGRVVEHALKLALVHACSLVHHEDIVAMAQAGEIEVGVESMGWAIELVKHLTLATETLIVGQMGENDFDRLRTRVLKQFERAGARGLTRAELSNVSRPFKGLKLRDQDDILSSLVAVEVIAPIVLAPISGQKRKVWVMAEHVPSSSPIPET